ncbi:hypothetical protein ACC703_38790, partial [Rhizobium ruizarguesonis]
VEQVVLAIFLVLNYSLHRAQPLLEQAAFVPALLAGFMAEKNPAEFDEMRERLLEAIDRSLWTPRSNSDRFDLATRHKNEVTQ